jgi:hypothetical protein
MNWDKGITGIKKQGCLESNPDQKIKTKTYHP